MAVQLRCEGCGRENRSDARFCDACGAPLAVQLAGRRKPATLVFCDMVASTATAEALDAEAVWELKRRYFGEMRAAIEAHGGSVEKFIGDAVVGVFGVPTAREDDAVRAVRAAVEMQERVAALNAALERELGVAIAVRIGVNSGEIVAGDLAAAEGLATGDAVNVAARLEQAAAPGEILVGAATARLARAEVELAEQAAIAVKGKEEPVAAYRVARLRLARRGAASDTELIGRADELALLAEAFDAACAQEACRVVTVVGDAGVGKSRLAAELAAGLDEKAAVLFGSCRSYGEGSTYWPLREVLAHAIGGDLEPATGRESLVAALGGGREAARAADALSQAVGLADSSADVGEIAWAMRRFLAAQARSRPLLLVLDDVQWAEPTFLDLVESLPQLEAAVLVVCLARRELADIRPAWQIDLALEPLDAASTARLVENVGGSLSDSLRARIVETAAGNPLFAAELASMVAETPVPDGDGVLLPTTLSALLAARLDALPEQPRAVLETAAVEGRIFHAGAVATLVDSRFARRVRPTLTALSDAGQIQPADPVVPGERAFAFGHALIRDAAYAALTKRARAVLHERYGRWLEEKAGTRLPEFEEVVGRHFEQAVGYREELGPLSDDARALAHEAGGRLAAAGERAFERSDLAAAASLLERARALLPPGDETRVALAFPLARALAGLGRRGDADDALDEVVSLAVDRGDAALEQRARLHRERVHLFTDPGLRLETAERIAQQSIEAYAALGDEGGLAEAWFVLGFVELIRGRYAGLAAAMERAVEHTRRAGRNDGQVCAWLAGGLCEGPTPVAEAIVRCEQLLAETSGMGYGTRDSLAQLYAMAGRLEDARATYEACVSLFNEKMQFTAEAVSRRCAAVVELTAGEPSLAVTHLRAAMNLNTQMGAETERAGVAARLADALWTIGDRRGAEEALSLAAEWAHPADAEAQILWRGRAGVVAAERGAAVEAQEHMRTALERADATDGLNLQGIARLRAAEALDALGDESGASAARDEALARFEAKGNVALARRVRAARRQAVRAPG